MCGAGAIDLRLMSNEMQPITKGQNDLNYKC